MQYHLKEKEVFLPIPIDGFKDKYKASNRGRILRNSFYLKCGLFSPEMIIKGVDKKGYLQVSLIVNGRRKKYSVHRLVAKTFIPNTFNKPDINHIDGRKHNNNITNLEWCTPEENNAHALKLGLLTYKEVPMDIRLHIKSIAFTTDFKSIALQFKISEGTARRIVTNRDGIGGAIISMKKLPVIKKIRPSITKEIKDNSTGKVYECAKELYTAIGITKKQFEKIFYRDNDSSYTYTGKLIYTERPQNNVAIIREPLL